jgi:hypothetical protein
MKEVTNTGKKGYKKKANNDHIHECLLPLAAEKKSQTRHNWRV